MRPRWWTDPDYKYGTPVFEPRRMSAQALTAKRMEMYKSFYCMRSNLNRVLDFRANSRDAWHFMAFLGLNLPAYREEAQRAQQALGLA